jgi:Uma2 family endonuclease
MVAKFRWKSSDLDLLPQEDGKRYEIIDGELLVTRAPHCGHQDACGEIFYYLRNWSKATNAGKAMIGPGVVFSELDNVIPDVVWIAQERLDSIFDESGHLAEAPDLVVEVLSLGSENQRRDRKLKLKLYSAQGVREYWMVDWRLKKVEIYRREAAQLILQATLFAQDTVVSPLLPAFECSVGLFFE